MQRDDPLRINGRADEQVEIGGYRVDLAEVRSALAAVAGVDQAVVIVREDRPGDRRLVGYITGTAHSTTTRVALAEQLPAYMVPTAVRVLDAFPMTSDGELDTGALPTPVYDDSERNGAVEQVIAEIFSQVLGVEHVDVGDSFFDLGGDSLGAMRVIAAVNTTFDAYLPLGSVFNAPTVTELASRLSGDSGGLRPLVA